MLNNFKELGANISIKVHYRHSHLERFPENLGDLSKEQGERFHQETKAMEERYQGRRDQHMIADYRWSLQCDCPDASYRRKTYIQSFKKITNLSYFSVVLLHQHFTDLFIVIFFVCKLLCLFECTNYCAGVLNFTRS